MAAVGIVTATIFAVRDYVPVLSLVRTLTADPGTKAAVVMPELDVRGWRRLLHNSAGFTSGGRSCSSHASFSRACRTSCSAKPRPNDWGLSGGTADGELIHALAGGV